ncbi:MAG: hypothetical protein KDI63_17600 [Gammaproteobacteria bacterium]|nr:hypothetical protein [Gammaproteobacteria bacterium]
MIEIAGTTYYFSELGRWVYGVVYVPALLLAVALLYWIVIRRLTKPWKGWVLALLLGAGLSWPFWDVYQIGREVTRLCQAEGGLHIYRTAETDGFLGAADITYWSKFGFSYVEQSYSYGSEVIRYTLQNGMPIHEKVAGIKSRYELLSTKYIENSYVERHIDLVRDRATGEVLGELKFFRVAPGKFDNFVYGVTGLTFTPWFCGNRDPSRQGKSFPRSHVALMTLKSLQKQGDQDADIEGDL